MELQGEDGSIVHLAGTSPKELGRGPGLAPRDRSVSRKQVRLQLQRISTSQSHGHFALSIEVVGPNPICVIHRNAADAADAGVEIVKPGTQSALTIGDKFSLSIQEPVFFTLRQLGARTDSAKCSERDQDGAADRLGIADEEGIAEAVARWQRRKQERLQGADRCESPENLEGSREKEEDPHGAKRFGFIVEGSEFERYGKKAHDTSMWDWRIRRRPGNDSDGDESEEEGGSEQNQRTSAGLKPKPKPKSKPRNEDDDDDWRDSEEEELLAPRKRPAQARKNGPASQDVATTSETRVSARKKRKIASPSSKVSRHGAASTSTKMAARRGRRASEDDDEEEDDVGGEDLDGFLVDDDDEEEEVGDEAEWADEDDEDEEVEEIEDPPAGAQAASDKRGVGRGSRRDDRPLCKYGNKCFRKNKDHLAEFRH